MDTSASSQTTGSRRNHLLARLKERGHRMTPQREAIVTALVKTHEHPTAEELHASLVAEHPTMSLATVYKTLNLLISLGEVQELAGHGDRARFDGMTDTPHPHLICSVCGRAQDLPAPLVDAKLAPACQDSILELANTTGYANLSLRLNLVGTCPDCAAKQTKAS